MKKLLGIALIAVVAVWGWRSCGGGKKAPPGGRALRLATTTSVVDSGLLDIIGPEFQKRTGYRLEASAVGSGKALAMLAAGEVDVAITHAPSDEAKAVAAGQASGRTPFARNDYVIVGPRDQAMTVAGGGDVKDVLREIARSGKTFVSRGDDSGTHRKEQALWRAAGVSARVVSTGAGMAATLERASKEKSFALADRATFITHRKKLALAILFQGDADLANVYAVVEPPAGGKGVNEEGARALAEFVRSEDGRALIGSYGVKQVGESLFTPVE
jgi:tungstate transport system substrate-binding protein